MNRAYKFRIYPTKEQEILIQKTFGCCRFIYNRMLADKIEAYEKDKINLKVDPAKYKDEFDWLKEVDSHALCSAWNNLNSAYNNFFKAKGKVGFPRFKSKHNSKKSYTTPICNNNIHIVDKGIILPKLKLVKVKFHRAIPDSWILKSVTISQNSFGKYFISILFEYENQVIEKELDKNNSLGLDYSSHDFYVDSEGNRANYPKFFRIYEDKLARESRKLSKMKLHSNNWCKQKIKVAKIQEKISNSRMNFCHQLSHKLAEKYDYVCVEDLNLRNIAQSLKLGKSTNDNGFGMFRAFLQYKLEDRGKKLLKIGKWDPTTIVCSCCGCYHKDIVNSLSIRAWICPDCGTHHDRDVNAAINIRDLAISRI